MKKNNYNILITGGAQGLGKIIAEQLVNQGHQVVVFDIMDNKKIPDDYLQKITYYQIDLAETEKVKEVVNQMQSNLKTSIDVLINNASIRKFNKFINYFENEIVKYLKVNIEAPLLLSKLLLPSMAKNNFGRIINISSKSGFGGYSMGSLYCSTKSALITFTESVAKELKKENKNVSMHVICPGSFQRLDGTKLKSYNFILQKILNVTNKIIHSDTNKICYSVLTLKEKIITFVAGIRKILTQL